MGLIQTSLNSVSGKLSTSWSELQRCFEVLSCASQFGNISGNREGEKFIFLCQVKEGKGNLILLIIIIFQETFAKRPLCLSPHEKMDWVGDRGW